MAGVIGTWGRERGLTFYDIDRAGHELPRYNSSKSMASSFDDGLLNVLRHAPGPSFRAMELLLGRISSLSEIGEFTTQESYVN